MHSGHRDRMRERFRNGEQQQFASHELLEMVLYSAIPRKDTNELAHRLIDAFGSLRGVLCAGEQALLQVEGMTPSAAFMICAMCAMTRRAFSETPQDVVISNTSQMCEYAAAYLVGYEVEKMLCICLDAKGKITATKILSTGTSSSVMVHVQHVVSFAITHNAHAVIIAHNHPSDNVSPSKEDVILTENLKNAMLSIGIEFVDHLVVGRERVHCILRGHEYSVHPAGSLAPAQEEI